MTGPRHRLKVTSPTGNPSQAVLELDGRQLDFVSRIELVLDADTGEATVRLSIPAATLHLDVDAQVLVTAHAPQEEAAAAAPTGGPCTATLLDVMDNVRRCIQPAGHYDETREAVWPTPLGPPDPGGLHTDGQAVWYDWAHGATPHGSPEAVQADG